MVRGERQQAAIDRASAESARELAAQLTDASGLILRAKALRPQALAGMEAFAAHRGRDRPHP